MGNADSKVDVKDIRPAISAVGVFVGKRKNTEESNGQECAFQRFNVNTNAPYFLQRNMYTGNQSSDPTVTSSELPNSPFYCQRLQYANSANVEDGDISTFCDFKNAPFFLQMRLYSSSTPSDSGIVDATRNSPFFLQQKLYAASAVEGGSGMKPREARSAPFYKQREACTILNNISKNKRPKAVPKPTISKTPLHSLAKYSTPFDRQRALYSLLTSSPDTSGMLKPREIQSAPLYRQRLVYLPASDESPIAIAPLNRSAQNCPFFLQQKMYSQIYSQAHIGVLVKPRESKSTPLYRQQEMYASGKHEDSEEVIKPPPIQKSQEVSPKMTAPSLVGCSTPFDRQRALYSVSASSSDPTMLLKPREIQSSPLFRQRLVYQAPEESASSEPAEHVKPRDAKTSPFYVQQKNYATCQSSCASPDAKLKPREAKNTPFYRQRQVYVSHKTEESIEVTNKNTSVPEKPSKVLPNLDGCSTPLDRQRALYCMSSNSSDSTSLLKPREIQSSPLFKQRLASQSNGADSPIESPDHVKPRDAKSSPFYLQQQLYASFQQSSEVVDTDCLKPREVQSAPYFKQRQLASNHDGQSLSEENSGAPYGLKAKEMLNAPFFRMQRQSSSATPESSFTETEKGIVADNQTHPARRKDIETKWKDDLQVPEVHKDSFYQEEGDNLFDRFIKMCFGQCT